MRTTPKALAVAVMVIGFAACGAVAAETLVVGSPLQESVGIDAESGAVVSWTIAGSEMMCAPSCFAVVDEASGKKAAFVAKSVRRNVTGVDVEAEVAELSLALVLRFSPSGSRAVKIGCTLTSLEARDRAVTLDFSFPLRKGDWRYGHLWTSTGFDRMAPGRTISQCVSFAGHDESQIPLGNLDDGLRNAVLAHSMRKQRFISYRGAMDASGTASLGFRVALGTSPDTARRPNAADFEFAMLGAEGGTDIRGAFAAYYETFPRCFETTAPQGGWSLWLGTNALAAAKRCGMANNQQEFEYAGDPAISVAASQRAGIAAMQYSEPWGMFMPIDKGWLTANFRPADAPKPEWCFKNYMKAVDSAAYRKYLAADIGSEVESDRYPGLTRDFTARALMNTAIETDIGEWAFHGCGLNGTFLWTRNEGRKEFSSAFLMVNSSPFLPHPNRYDIQLNQVEYTAKRLAAKGLKLDMVYLDSICWGLGWNYYNFRRDHWKHADVPLTWAKVRGKAVPAMHNALHNAECLAAFRRYCEERGYAILGNSWDPVVQYCLGFMDALGCGEHVSSDLIDQTQFRIFRFLGNRKPLSTQDYRLSDAEPDEMERRLNRGLMYGVFSGTSNKWKFPEVVERLLAVCPRYAEMLHAINDAGWEVLTRATVTPPGLVERWGAAPESGLYFTVMNASGKEERLTVTIDAKRFPTIGEDCRAVELVDGVPLDVERSGDSLLVSLHVKGGRTQLIQIRNQER